MIKTHRLHLQRRIDYLSCSFIAILTSKLGTISYIFNSYSSYIYPKAIDCAWLFSETILYAAGSLLFVVSGYFHIAEISHGTEKWQRKFKIQSGGLQLLLLLAHCFSSSQRF